MARHADGRNAINHGNGRAAALARWLRVMPPDRYTMLMLEVKVDGEWERVQGWRREEVNELLAATIEELAQDHANEVAQYSLMRVAWWCPDDEKYWTSRDLRVQAQLPEGATDAGQVFSGEHTNAMIQTQRHVEKMAGAYIGGMSGAMAALREANAQLRDECVDLREDNRSLRQRVSELELENMRLTALAEQAADTAEGLVEKVEQQDKQSNVIDMVTKAVAKNLQTQSSSSS